MHREDLWKVISRAKLLLYPSHQDAFPLTVLEALFLGLAVVAYDIPALKYIYGGLKPVFLVKEGDVKALAEKAIEVLRMKDEKFKQLHDDKNLKNFLEAHSSWENVAKAEFKYLKLFLNIN